MRGHRGKFCCAVGWAALIAGAAQAQDAATSISPTIPAESVSTSSDIVVTGTRIRRAELESNSPQTVVSAEEIRYQGALGVEQVLNRLPQFTADANENVSNGSDGTSRINLRNLGSNRVLTLVDGQRLMPTQAVNLNLIPSALVERVDVLTGGASAVYGSDALSGVVNFVLKKDLDGIRIDAQAGFAQHDNNNETVRGIVRERGFELAPSTVDDGAKQDITIAAGKNFAGGRGNLTGYFGYRNIAPVRQSSRDVSSCALQDQNNGTELFCGGSSNTPYGSFVPLSENSPLQGQTLINNIDGSPTVVPYSNDYAYNYAPDNYFQRPGERIVAGGFGRFELHEAAELYGSFMYMNDQTFSQVAPSGIWLGTAFPISCNNPLANAAQLSAICGPAAGTNTTEDALVAYRTTVTPRRDNLRYNDYRYTAGIRGDLGSGFSYDVNYLYSLVKYKETYLNDVNQVRAGRALNVIDVNGVPTCRSVIDGTDADCVPVNVWQPFGVTEEQTAYLFTDSNTASRNALQVFSASLSGDLGEMGITLPWASRGVGIALGAERRRETLDFTADEVAQQNGTRPSDGIIAVTEAFGEIEIPLIEDRPFFQSLSINGGLRYSAYDNEQGSTGISSSYNVWTYKGELSWQMVDDLRLRASYNHAIRAPNVGELFAAQTVGNVAAQDPCAGANPAASLETCALTGVTAAQYGRIVECPAATCSALGGGNVALRPETADTYTAGFVLTPRAVRRFSLSVDYYNIKVQDYIGTIAPSLTVGQCAATGDPFFCNLFTRDPRSGALFGQNAGFIRSTTLNTGFLKTSGIDIVADYAFDIGAAGRFGISLVGTYLIDQVAEPVPGVGSYDCKGLFGYTCGQPSPEWRHVARFSYTAPSETLVSVSWRHLGGTDLSSLTDNPLLNAPQTVVNSRIKDYNYIDLTVNQPFADNFVLRAGVNNVFDLDPPALSAGLLQTFGNGNTYPGVYDPLGRTVFFGFTANF